DVRQIVERMTERFRLLAGRGRQDRQSTLRAMLDWSWDLLTADERQALAQLSVFEGGWTLDAAEAILALEPLSATEALPALVDKSLARLVGDRRFGLLVSVHEYAAEKLEVSGVRLDTERRHGVFFAVTSLEEAVDAHGGIERVRALSTELGNLVTACRRA